MLSDQKPFKNGQAQWLQREGCNSNDLSSFNSRLRSLAARFRLNVRELGHVQDNAILLLQPKSLSNTPRVLIAGGFHGDEPAGSWGIIRFLENLSEYPKAVDLSFLPLVNPTGFIAVKRENYLGQDPNRGYYHPPLKTPVPSQEGRILMSNLLTLKALARDIFVSLHEDWEFDKFYIYTFEDSPKPTNFSTSLLSAERKFFEPFPDGPLEGGIVKDGLIFNLCDGSFEDMLFHSGVPMTACTETPGKLQLDERVVANAHIIHQVVEFAQTLGSNPPNK